MVGGEGRGKICYFFYTGFTVGFFQHVHGICLFSFPVYVFFFESL